MVFRWLFLSAFFSFVLFVPAAHAGPQLTLESSTWGVGGGAGGKTFTTVWLEVRNDGDETFDGRVWLEPVAGYGLQTDRTSVGTSAYLLPGETRVVGLTPWLRTTADEWDMHWAATGPDDDAENTASLNGPSGRAAVTPASSQADEVIRIGRPGGRSRLPVVSPVRFPAKLGALNELRAIVVDGDLGLQPRQEDAVIRWVQLGGTVVLARGPADRPTEMGGGLAGLNGRSEFSRLGRGLIWRPSRRADDLTADEVMNVVRRRLHGWTEPSPGEKLAWDADNDIVRSLRDLSREKSLALLFVPVAIAYVFGLWRLGEVTREERWGTKKALLSLAALVAVATALLLLVSPLRGEVKRTRHSLVIATPLVEPSATERPAGVVTAKNPAPENTASKNAAVDVDVRQWALARSGIGRTITVPERAEGQLVWAESVAARSEVRDGPRQTLTSVEPPLTESLLRARGTVKARPPRFALEEFRSTVAGFGARLVPRPGETMTPPIALLTHEDRAVLLEWDGRGLSVRRFASQGVRQTTVFALGPLNWMRGERKKTFLGYDGPYKELDEGVLANALSQAVFAERNATGVVRRADVRTAADRVRAYLLAPPDETLDLLAADGDDNASGESIVIWSLEFPVPSN